MRRFTRSAAIACAAATIACAAWTMLPVGASSVGPAAQVNNDYNAAAKAGGTFERQFEADVADYGVISVETLASTIVEQTYKLATPLENEQQALVGIALDDKLSAKTRLASAILVTTITKFVYLLGISGFAAGGVTGIEGWAKTFESTKTLYEKEGKTVLNDLGFSVNS